MALQDLAISYCGPSPVRTARECPMALLSLLGLNRFRVPHAAAIPGKNGRAPTSLCRLVHKAHLWRLPQVPVQTSLWTIFCLLQTHFRMDFRSPAISVEIGSMSIRPAV